MLDQPILWEFSGITFYPVPISFDACSLPFGGETPLFGWFFAKPITLPRLGGAFGRPDW